MIFSSLFPDVPLMKRPIADEILGKFLKGDYYF
jgi:hypothetical protein